MERINLHRTYTTRSLSNNPAYEVVMRIGHSEIVVAEAYNLDQAQAVRQALEECETHYQLVTTRGY